MIETPHPYEIGQNYLIRTVTMIQCGRLKAVYDHELVLSDAAWIADTGRFHTALKEGKLLEVEPFTYDAIVGRGAIIDATKWPHKLPRDPVPKSKKEYEREVYLRSVSGK